MLFRSVSRALPIGGIELEADAAFPLILMSVKVVTRQREPVAQVRLERHIGGLALALDGAVVKADVLAAHEHAVGLPVTVHIDAAVGILHDTFRNRRAIPCPYKTVVGAGALGVLAVEDSLILVEALGWVSTRVRPARRARPRGVGEITGNLQTPAAVVVE